MKESKIMRSDAPDTDGYVGFRTIVFAESYQSTIYSSGHWLPSGRSGASAGGFREQAY